MLKKLIIAFAIVLVIFFSGIIFLTAHYVAPIIMYHSVNPYAAPGNMLAITQDTLERQMRFLKAMNYNVVSLDALANLIKERKKIPPKTLAITFDDGYEDNFGYVFPILKKYNFCATIFVITNEIGRVQGDRLSWDEIKIMQDSGIINIGSHTLGPEPLTNIKSSKEIKRQIFNSKKILEEKTKKPVTAFSYPEGRFNEEIRKLVIDAGYKFAVTTNPGKEFRNDDLFALKRLRISSNANNLFIFWFETSGLYNFLREHRRKHK